MVPQVFPVNNLQQVGQVNADEIVQLIFGDFKFFVHPEEVVPENSRQVAFHPVQNIVVQKKHGVGGQHHHGLFQLDRMGVVF